MPAKKSVTIQLVHDNLQIVHDSLQRLYMEFQTFREEFGIPRNEFGTLRNESGTLRNEFQTFSKESRIFREEFHTHRNEFHFRMDRVETSQAATLAELVTINMRLSSLETITAGLGVRLHTLHGLTEKLDKRVERLDHEYVAITAALKRLEKGFDAFEAERLAQRVGVLEQKIAEIEKTGRN